jgi:hypothetical protein
VLVGRGAEQQVLGRLLTSLGAGRSEIVEWTSAGAEAVVSAAAPFEDALKLRLRAAVPAHELWRFGTVLSWLGGSRHAGMAMNTRAASSARTCMTGGLTKNHSRP